MKHTLGGKLRGKLLKFTSSVSQFNKFNSTLLASILSSSQTGVVEIATSTYLRWLYIHKPTQVQRILTSGWPLPVTLVFNQSTSSQLTKQLSTRTQYGITASKYREMLVYFEFFLESHILKPL